MILEIPKDILAVLARFDHAGIEVWCVGGCVRDALLGETPHDWDLCTTAQPEETCALLKDLPQIPTGLQHGTVTVLTETRRPLEITTYRTDSTYTDHRHPDTIQFTRSLYEDCARRDFTINAMAYHPIRGFIDFFGGMDDVAHHILRCVGNPDIRFAEDALRILRALRFASVLGFSIEEHTANALQRQKALLAYLAKERIVSEFIRLISGKHAAGILYYYADVFAVFLPCLSALLEKQEQLCTAFAASDKPDIRLAVIFILCGVSADDTETLLHTLTLDRRTIRAVSCLMREKDLPPPKNRIRARKRLFHSTLDNAISQLTLYAALHPEAKEEVITAKEHCNKVYNEGDVISLSMLKIRGTTLIAHGIQGADIGKTLQKLAYAVMENRVVNEKDALLQWILHNS